MSPLSSVTNPLLNHLAKREATGEGGLITGTNPVVFTSSDPVRLWIVQVGIIIMTTQLLSFGFRRLRQPKVIAEVFGGILLGPTAFGRIPGFTERIFPSVSIPYLSLVADIGLCFFLFLVGLEIDMNLIRRNARTSVIVSLVGIAIPFGLGSVLSIPLYHRFIDSSVHFTYFMLFTGVAYSITAFPILCRVLTELKLLDTPIGIVALSAGVGNDIIGWTLLALSVALVNAGSGLSAVWILIVCVAFTVFLLLPVKFVMLWLARKTGSTENGPTMFYMTVVMILLWASAFFTDCIGVNAIFGAFLVGLVVPREGGLAIALTEKLEDMISIIFLPLYFALSGLNTNLGLLNNGITWAFTIAIVALSFCGKFGGCLLASRVLGYGWRESSTIGALMSCKGLVELIVLNVGLQAGILSQRVFSMFVLEALVLTFVTTPLVSVLYPPERRVSADETATPTQGDKRGKDDDKASIVSEDQPWRHRFTVVLDKLDHVPSAMALTQLVLPPHSPPSDATSTMTTADTMDKLKLPYASLEALRLVDFSDRTSALMKSSVVTADGSVHVDPVLGIFRMFGELNALEMTSSLSVVPYDEFAQSVAEHARRHASHLVLLPWLPTPTASTVAVDAPDASGHGHGHGDKDGDGDGNSSIAPKSAKSEHNPFDLLFGSTSGSKTDAPFSMATHSQFVRGVFSRSKTDVALYVDTGDRSGVRLGGGFVHVFLPFFGGPDDRLALELVVQLCLNPKTTATVVRMVKQHDVAETGAAGGGPERPSSSTGMGHSEHLEDRPARDVPHQTDPFPVPHLEVPLSPISTMFADTVNGPPTPTGLQSETADSIAWVRYAHHDADATPTLARQALSRIHFSDMYTPTPAHAAVQHARTVRETKIQAGTGTGMEKGSSRLLIVVGRSRRRVARGEGHRAEMKRLLETYHHHHHHHHHHHRSGVGLEGMRTIIGGVGTTMVVGGSASAVLVVQAADTSVALD